MLKSRLIRRNSVLWGRGGNQGILEGLSSQPYFLFPLSTAFCSPPFSVQDFIISHSCIGILKCWGKTFTLDRLSFEQPSSFCMYKPRQKLLDCPKCSSRDTFGNAQKCSRLLILQSGSFKIHVTAKR